MNSTPTTKPALTVYQRQQIEAEARTYLAIARTDLSKTQSLKAWRKTLHRAGIEQTYGEAGLALFDALTAADGERWQP